MPSLLLLATFKSSACINEDHKKILTRKVQRSKQIEKFKSKYLGKLHYSFWSGYDFTYWKIRCRNNRVQLNMCTSGDLAVHTNEMTKLVLSLLHTNKRQLWGDSTRESEVPSFQFLSRAFSHVLNLLRYQPWYWVFWNDLWRGQGKSFCFLCVERNAWVAPACLCWN